MKYFYTALISIWLGAILGYKLHNPRVEYITTVDTVTVEKPVMIHDTLVAYEHVRIPYAVHDTTMLTEVVLEHDTTYLNIDLPRTQKLYKGAQYSAWVSGFIPALDSIQVYNTTHTVVNKSIRFGGFGTTNISAYPSLDFGFYMAAPKQSLDIKIGYHIQKNTAAPFLGVTYYIPFNGNKKKL